MLDILKQLANSGLVARLTQLVAADNAISAVIRDDLKKFGGRDSDIQAYRDPLMDDGTRRVDILLAALRKWRAKGLRMLLLGSIGMVGLARRHRLELSHLNDLTRLEVPLLERHEAEEFVEYLAKGAYLADWTRDHTRCLIEESAAWYTSILQYGFQRLTLGGRSAPLAKAGEIFAGSSSFKHELSAIADGLLAGCRDPGLLCDVAALLAENYPQAGAEPGGTSDRLRRLPRSS